MIDSIVRMVKGGPYRREFAHRLPKLIHHVFIKVNDWDVKEKLRKIRQSWEGILLHEVLQKIDEAMQVDEYWPSLSQQKLIAELNDVNIKLARMQKEVDFLKMQANEATIRTNVNIEPTLPSSSQLPNHSKSPVLLQTQIKPRKRFNRPVPAELPLPKKMKYEENVASPNGSPVSNFVSSESSVFLTPSPEPRDQLFPPPKPTINDKLNIPCSDFWMSMMKTGEQKKQVQQKSQNLFTRQDEDIGVPFLFDLFGGSTDSMPKFDKIIDCSESKVVDSDPLTTGDNAVLIQAEEKSNMMAVELDLDTTSDSFKNSALDVKTICAQNGDGILQTPYHLDDFEIEFQQSDSQRSTPSSIDCNIDIEPCKPQMVKKIKVNLLNPKLFEEEPVSLDNKRKRKKQSQQPRPCSEWETPTISFKMKDSLKDAKFQTGIIHREGMEKSGMCSIM